MPGLGASLRKGNDVGVRHSSGCVEVEDGCVLGDQVCQQIGKAAPFIKCCGLSVGQYAPPPVR